MKNKKIILKCVECGQEYDEYRIKFTCDECESLIEVHQDLSNLSKEDIITSEGFGVWRYQNLLPIKDNRYIVTMGEGGSPLIKCDRLARDIGLKNLYIKYDALNPTGSFKDRGMSIAVSRALKLKVKDIFCASTGNTAASLSAYAARAGVNAILILPRDVPSGKLSQALLFGAKILGINGNFDDAMNLVRKLEEKNCYLINSINPYRIEGQKTVGFEILEQLKWIVPDHIIFPVGSGGNIVANYKGFLELENLDIIKKMPKLGCIQAKNVDPIVKAIKSGAKIVIQRKTSTVAGGINIGSPVNGSRALNAIKKSDGLAEVVTDEEILKAQYDLARMEGIGAEPTGAVPIAGIRKLVEYNKLDYDESVVSIITGHALKDPKMIINRYNTLTRIHNNVESVLDALKRHNRKSQ